MAVLKITSISALAEKATVWFVDIWGVLHNGVAPYASAVEACASFRASGGSVVLVSNSPRLAANVEQQLTGIGVPRSAYDTIVTSGDVTRALIADWRGQGVFHLGPKRDLPIFGDSGIVLVSAEDARVIVCTGLFDDETETPADYESRLRRLSARNVPMICANPDKTVLRNGKTISCAGALAEAYEHMGGRAAYAGKPYAPVYEAAFARVRELTGQDVAKEHILAIGDGIATDIEGAHRAGIRSVFIASGLHKTSGDPAGLFQGSAGKPVAIMPALAW